MAVKKAAEKKTSVNISCRRIVAYHRRTKRRYKPCDFTMPLFIALTITLIGTPMLLTAQEKLGTYEDRIGGRRRDGALLWTVDSLDADGYVAVFTEDAVIDSNGSISKGHEEIRKIVTNLIKRRDDDKAKGLPTSNLYHVISTCALRSRNPTRPCISRTGRPCAATKTAR